MLPIRKGMPNTRVLLLTGELVITSASSRLSSTSTGTTCCHQHKGDKAAQVGNGRTWGAGGHVKAQGDSKAICPG